MNPRAAHESADDAVTALALKAGQGDRAALTDFIQATQKDVWRLLAHLGGQDIADDLTQETYLRVMSALPRFAARSSARTWILSLARRVWVDNIRHDMARPRKASTQPEAIEARTPSSSTWTEWVDARLLIDALPPERPDTRIHLRRSRQNHGCTHRHHTLPRRPRARRRDRRQPRPRTRNQGVGAGLTFPELVVEVFVAVSAKI